MDIFIKSFNRPYYLERCIRSIHQHVSGSYTIKILDDGTPPEYLDKIKKDFPTVEIYCSPLHEKKAEAIKKHVEGKEKYNISVIPVSFWVDAVTKGSKVFLLLEDDIWLTSTIDLEAIKQSFAERNIAIMKLMWLGNPNIVHGDKIVINADIEEIVPKLKPFTYELLINKFKSAYILKKLGLVKFSHYIPCYALYTVAGAFFDREYWLYLWRDSGNTVKEKTQLAKALLWKKNNPHSAYTKTRREIAKTSFITSATNNAKGVDFDIFVFNHHINQKWHAGQLNALENYPVDFSMDYIGQMLDEIGEKKCSRAGWLLWVERFKARYRKIGCEVD